ncbi:MAG: hypothetical protein M1814_005113 [Vezdaea aestivalis]|nr:MAG: hypothetical protein M1814_005113 [Vezdaea aestivalis]
MSDLLGGNPSTLPTGVADNGSLRPTGGAPASQSPGPKTPREIMAERRKRDQTRKENEEARKRLAEEEEARRRRSSGGRAAAAGIAGGSGGEGGVGSSARPQDDSTYRRPQNITGTSASQPGDRRSGRNPSGNGQKAEVGPTGTYVPTGSGERPMEPMATRRDQGNGNGAAPISSGRQRSGSASQGQNPQSTSRQPPAANYRAPDSQPSTQAQPQTTRTQPTPGGSQPQPQARTATGAASSAQAQPRTAGQQSSRAGAEPSRARNSNQSSFPHAFERWETLSSHWEGLTAYWIRRLQDNSSEISQQPLNQQMSRQITDLSAAGANLFHAVVELQRLRASSERKFQRWFLETSSEKERSMEVQAELQNLLARERELRSEASRAISRVDVDKLNAERMVGEMKRELQISKEEARRAWEELGRREQEERDRTRSLKEGEPTIVGGVQVVPMAGGLSRGPSTANRPPTRDGPYPPSSARGGQEDAQYASDPRFPAPADDPFISTRPPQSAGSDLPIQGMSTTSASYPPIPAAQTAPIISTASPVQSSATATAPARGGFYQHQGIALAPGAPGATTTTAHDFPDDETISEEEPEVDAHGNFRTDAHGRRIPYQAPLRGVDDEVSDEEYDKGARAPGYQQRYAGTSGVSASTAYGPPVGAPGQRFEPVDYSGEDYPGWENVRTHHHPTRLSDVQEEDERSRTSPSRASVDNGSRR